MHPPQLRHPPLKDLIVSRPLHRRTLRFAQIFVPAPASFLIRKIIVRAVLLLRISMTGTSGLSAKHVLLHHGANAHVPGPHELTLQTPPNFTELINPLPPSAHVVHVVSYILIILLHIGLHHKKKSVSSFF